MRLCPEGSEARMVSAPAMEIQSGHSDRVAGAGRQSTNYPVSPVTSKHTTPTALMQASPGAGGKGGGLPGGGRRSGTGPSRSR